MRSGGDLPAWQRRLKDHIGENPARFLDHRLVEYGADHTDHTLARMVRDRIAGIDRIEVVRAWKAAERRLDRGPRRPILKLLEEREAFLEDRGERPDNLRTEWSHELPERYRPHDRDREQADVYWVDEDGERRPWAERPTSPSTGSAADMLTYPSREVATDGGVDQ